MLSTSDCIQAIEGVDLILLDEKQQEISLLSTNFVALAQSTAASLAYIIYTSGTTGTPKGIPITQHGLDYLLTATQARYQLQCTDNILLLAPFTFDASILEIFWPLSYGACITIPPANIHKEPVFILKMVSEYGITVLQAVPTFLAALAEAQQAQSSLDLSSLRLMISGGSPLSRKLRDQVLRLFPCRLANHYGPTEVAVDAACCDATQEFIGDQVPIGRPLPNAKIFILDKYKQLAPIGAIGEIYIHSPGLTPGYLHDNEKNQQAFIEIQPLTEIPPLRAFKSGDLGYFDEQGILYFCGRKDSQIKINGNRIEISDIESVLERHPLVKRAIVKSVPHQQTQDGRLAAFIEPTKGINQFIVDGNVYYQFTLAQQPELLAAMTAIHLQTWPKYFAGSSTIKEYWQRVVTEFPEYQFCLLDANHQPVAIGNGIPFYWDGHLETTPAGWDAGVALAFSQLARGIAPNTVLGLTGIVNSGFQGKGLSTRIVQAFRALAKMHGLTRFLGPVRPVGMLNYKTHDFEGWTKKKGAKGEPLDFWLRTHQRIGGKILNLACQSQLVVGTLEQWHEWTGEKWQQSGEYYIKDLLQALVVDIEQDRAVYYDPSIWVGHYELDKAEGVDFHLSLDTFRRYLLENLPAYMVPQQYHLLTHMPLAESGKINASALPEFTGLVSSSIKLPRTQLQRDIVKLWQKILAAPTVGVSDNFFLLGGQSLQVIRMLAEIARCYQVNISLREFYFNPTIEAITERLEKNLSSELKAEQEQALC